MLLRYVANFFWHFISIGEFSFVQIMVFLMTVVAYE